MNRIYEWTKVYNPKKGIYQFRHKGSGLITDNLLVIKKKVNPIIKNIIKKSVTSRARPLSKKSEKAGDIILRQLAGLKK